MNMQIFDHFKNINLTADQREALLMIDSFLKSSDRVFILQGYAGSGKTTLLKGLIRYLGDIKLNVQLMAPTGRAAKIVNQKTGEKATTIHKSIYSLAKLEEIKTGEESNDLSFMFQFSLRLLEDVKNSVIIIDEASMVGDNVTTEEFFRFGSGRILKDLISYGRIQEVNSNNKIIFVGDPAQLPPVGMNFSPALDVAYLNQEYQLSSQLVEMKEVKRQTSGNGILTAASKIRKNLTSGYYNDFDLRENKTDMYSLDFVDFLVNYRQAEGKKIIICFKNSTQNYLNRLIREDKFGSVSGVCERDIIIIGRNNYNYDLMNGEFGVVNAISDEEIHRQIRFNKKGGKGDVTIVDLKWRKIELLVADENNGSKAVIGYFLENYLYGDGDLSADETQALYVDFTKRHPNLKRRDQQYSETLRNDPFFSCIMFKFGYAVTCHKAQGGEWANAFVFWDKSTNANQSYLDEHQSRSGKTNTDFYRWAYTAITRASKKLYNINPPYFTSFSNMIFVGKEVQSDFSELLNNKYQLIDLDYTEDVRVLFAKYDLERYPQVILDHFLSYWHHFRKLEVQIYSWEVRGYESRFVFQKGDDTAAIKLWFNGKYQFNGKFQQLPSMQHSQSLYDQIIVNLESIPIVHLNRESDKKEDFQNIFDPKIEEEQPFLYHLYEVICICLNGIQIRDIAHMNYRERYCFARGSEQCSVDFEYNADGFFGRVLPLEKKTNSPALLAEIKELVERIKIGNYVIQ